MCSRSRVQPSSAFVSSTTSTETPTVDQQSLLIRQKKVLTRDDSGVFSSPSPLTPSRGPLTVFPLPPSPPSSVACSTSTAPTHPPPSQGVMSTDEERLPQNHRAMGLNEDGVQVSSPRCRLVAAPRAWGGVRSCNKTGGCVKSLSPPAGWL